MIAPSLVREILQGYALPPMGIHGLPHWGRVLETGLRLAKQTGANLQVVTLFSVFHDARRVNDIIDPGHGTRGAELAREMRSKHLTLTDDEFNLLELACAQHTDGTTEGDVTVQTCWDADRLDLWRVMITPSPIYLCTPVAKETAIQRWARERSLSNFTPDFVEAEWLNKD